MFADNGARAVAEGFAKQANCQDSILSWTAGSFFFLAFFPFIFSAGPLLSPIHVIDLRSSQIQALIHKLNAWWLLTSIEYCWYILWQVDQTFFSLLTRMTVVFWITLMYQELLSIRSSISGIHHFILPVWRFSFKVARYATSPWTLQNFHSNESA